MGRQARLSLPEAGFLRRSRRLAPGTCAADRHPRLVPDVGPGRFSRTFPEYVGVASAEVNGAMSLFNEADVVLTVGARVDYRLGYGQPPVCREGSSSFGSMPTPPRSAAALGLSWGWLPIPTWPCTRSSAVRGSWTGSTKIGLLGVRSAREEFLQRWQDFGWEDGEPPACYPPLPGD